MVGVREIHFKSLGTPARILPVPMVFARVGLTIGGMGPGFPMGPDQFRSLQFDTTVSENAIHEFGMVPRDIQTLG